jgi:hypothetical protein
MCKEFIAAHPHVAVVVDDGIGSTKVEDRRTTIAIVLLSGDNHNNAVFSIGEALCNPHDVFDKKLGTKIAVNRAHHADNDGACQCTLAEIETMEEYEGYDDVMSAVVSPLTGTPIPYGLINRVKMLIPKN